MRIKRMPVQYGKSVFWQIAQCNAGSPMDYDLSSLLKNEEKTTGSAQCNFAYFRIERAMFSFALPVTKVSQTITSAGCRHATFMEFLEFAAEHQHSGKDFITFGCWQETENGVAYPALWHGRLILIDQNGTSRSVPYFDVWRTLNCVSVQTGPPFQKQHCFGRAVGVILALLGMALAVLLYTEKADTPTAPPAIDSHSTTEEPEIPDFWN